MGLDWRPGIGAVFGRWGHASRSAASCSTDASVSGEDGAGWDQGNLSGLGSESDRSEVRRSNCSRSGRVAVLRGASWGEL